MYSRVFLAIGVFEGVFGTLCVFNGVLVTETRSLCFSGRARSCLRRCTPRALYRVCGVRRSALRGEALQDEAVPAERQPC